ncbi:hypothetical protein ACVV2G_18455 [Streptomyces ziwulingensis]
MADPHRLHLHLRRRRQRNLRPEPDQLRTDETWTPFTQLAAYTQTDQAYAGVDNAQHLTRDSASLTNAATGVTGQNVSGTATGFVREPSGTLAAMTSGQENNTYLYATSDPVDRTDPTGLFSWSDALEIGSDVLGVATGCLSGTGAASTSGATESASVSGPVGTATAIIGSYTVGGFADY